MEGQKAGAEVMGSLIGERGPLERLREGWWSGL